MRINILDAALLDRSGHHFDFDSKLLKHYAQAGHRVHVYGYAGMSDEVVEDFAPYGKVTKLFRAYQYGGLPFDPFARELDAFIWKSEIFATDLRSVEPADLWIWPTARPYNLHACTLAGVEAPVVACIHIDPGIAARSVGAMLWRSAFLAAQRQGLRYMVGSIEPELRHRFMPIVPDGRFMMIPQPFDGPPIERPKSALKRIGVLGQQRKEKGTDLLEPLFERLIGDGYAITFQNSNRAYTGGAHPQIERLEFVEDFAEPVAACDLVVLPYHPEQYAAKGSGILAQCLALGIPVIGPIGTLPGRLIEQYRVGPLFAAATLEAIYAAIKFADANYAAFADNAWRAAQQFSKRNGVAQFAAALLSAAQ
jgi:hypothetical protein